MNKIRFKIGNRTVGVDYPVLVIAEVSANHNGSLKRAKEIVKTACELGAGAIKIQTYTADTMTLPSDKEPFQIKVNPAWKGRTLYDLYESAYTPWEWDAELKQVAESYGIPLLSTAYDDASVDFLEKLGVPAYKIASFENTDLELLKKVAQTKKPVIISRGMSTLAELTEAISTLRKNGAPDIAVLHCVSSYPAKPEEMNLATISDIGERFKVVPGLSDHTITTSTAVAAVALGACIIEKHFTLRRADGGFDAAFSLEPKEFEELIKSVKDIKKAFGKVSYEVGSGESENIVFKRSLWVIKPIKKGEKFTRNNVGRFRPGNGLPVKSLSQVLSKVAKRNITANTPMSWDLVEE
ncbi:MAG: pseudaminic acid synthase [Parcubacteria group bacterium]